MLPSTRTQVPDIPTALSTFESPQWRNEYADALVDPKELGRFLEIYYTNEIWLRERRLLVCEAARPLVRILPTESSAVRRVMR